MISPIRSAGGSGRLRQSLLVALLAALLAPASARTESWSRVATATDWGGARGFVTAFAEPAPLTAPTRRAETGHPALPAGGRMDRLLALIALAEVRKGYDSVNLGARIRPPAPPSQLNLGQIFDWIAATPGQPHAIGRYQFIPDTLRRLVRIAGLTRETRFDAPTQDLLARLLVSEAGWSAFMAGTLPRAAFMDNLARIWAGLPLASGRSAYHGIAGNRATITRARYAALMQEIFG